jgi:Sec-independent protein translocase protein TatA
MFGLGYLPDCLFYFRPKRLPESGRSLGQAMRGFKKGLEEGAIPLKPNEPQKHNQMVQK